MSENLSRMLKNLETSAPTLGVEKFFLLYSKSLGGGRPIRSHDIALLKALQDLERALLAYIPSQP